ncbi:MAG: ThiF family adenylyltransferase [Kiritimatiellae bacterium]|nr:ThiF family adenylyltransferase [Kiritimatiellia bacterium]
MAEADGEGAFSRSAALLGEEAVRRLADAHVLVVGVGGVGSWCAEALVRTGVGHVAVMDDDVVAASNLNRQCPATAASVGRRKVDAMRERLLAVNPSCDVAALAARFTGAEDIGGFDAVVDAIDSVACKAALIAKAAELGIYVVSSMGAALRSDPTRVRVSRFDRVSGDGLARALRRRFRAEGRGIPRFECVWSDEPPQKTAERGSLMQVTATFGMCLAARVIARFA